MKLRCSVETVIAYDKWHSVALKCYEDCEHCLLSGRYVTLNVSTGMFNDCQYLTVVTVSTGMFTHCQYFTVVTVSTGIFSQSLPVLDSCHSQHGHVQSVIASTLQLSLPVLCSYHCQHAHVQSLPVLYNLIYSSVAPADVILF